MKKSFLKTALSGFIGLASFMGCQNENLPQENLDSTTEKNFKVFSYTPEQANELNERVFASSGKTLQSLTSKREKGNFRIDHENVYTVLDSIGNLTHAYRVFLEEQKPFTILNIVVAERADGSQTQSFIIEYEFEPEYFEDKLDGELEREYERTVSYYPLSNFSFDENGKSSFTSKSNDPCNRDTQSVNPSSGSGGSYNPNYFNFFSSGSSSVGPAGPMSGLNNYGGGSTSVGTVEVGQGCFCENIGYESKGSPMSKNSDCPNVRTVVPVNEDVDVLLIPSCQSFEYANGTLVKGAGVSNIQNHFVAAGFDNNGNPYAAHIHLNIPKSYFSMPKHWTNGGAANATANALHTANLVTKAWFLANPKAKGSQLSTQWEKNIKSAMRAIGGDFTRNEPFPIKNLAPYAEDWAWDKTDCTK